MQMQEVENAPTQLIKKNQSVSKTLKRSGFFISIGIAQNMIEI